MNTHTVGTTDNTPVEPQAPLDLVSMVTAAMSAAGHARPTDWQRRLTAEAFNMEVTDDKRRFLVNRALRMVLADVTDENTMDIRYCLVDQGDIDRWFALVQSEVIPCIVRHDLPPAIN